MVTVVIPTRDRPQMLRTALRSVERQTALAKIGLVIVSENGGNRASSEVCREFPSLPIRYVFRDPMREVFSHGERLFGEAAAAPHPYVAVLHDDDWWADQHILSGVGNLQKHADALSYWSSSFLVEGEHSWIITCWNISSWIATDFGALTEIARMDRRQAGIACLGSGPAHYSTLIAEKHALYSAYSEVLKTGNRFDSDRLLFLEFAKQGTILMNFVPEAFIRQHPAQDQVAMSSEQSAAHVAAGTRAALDFCREQGVDVVREFERLYKACPAESFKIWFERQLFDLRAIEEMERQGALPLSHLVRPPAVTPPRNAKWLFKQICPPAVLAIRRLLRSRFTRS